MAKQTPIDHAHIFGPVHAYARYTALKPIVIEAHENYQKRSTRNRYTIAGANGPLTLTIPLEKGKNQKMPIRRARIAYHENWFAEHRHAIQSAYANAAYFLYYYQEIFSLLEQRFEYLYQLNVTSLKLMLKLLGMDRHIEETESFQKPPHPGTNVYVHDEAYPQVFSEKHGFLPNLSILDLLFCMGPEARPLLKKMVDSPSD